MQMGVQGHRIGHGFGAFGGQGGWRGMAGESGQSRGERIVARLDGNDDGKLDIAELAESRLGRKMSVERFARTDTNGDLMLDAAEIDAMRRGKHGTAMREAAMRSRYAAYLAEKVEPRETDDGDVATELIRLLDGDGSGRLNSEEIAGTRLAQLIGGDFFEIDADRNGGLDRAELSGFLTQQLAGAVEPGGDAVGATPQVPGSVEAGTASATSYEQGIRTAFDNALMLLGSGNGSATPTEVVQSLYAEVKTLLNMT